MEVALLGVGSGATCGTTPGAETTVGTVSGLLGAGLDEGPPRGVDSGEANGVSAGLAPGPSDGDLGVQVNFKPEAKELFQA